MNFNNRRVSLKVREETVRVASEFVRAGVSDLGHLLVGNFRLSRDDVLPFSSALRSSSAALTRLVFGPFEDSGTAAILEALSNPAASVDSLALGCSGMGKEGLLALSGTLMTSKTLKNLSISATMDEDTTRALANALALNASLQSLSMSSVLPWEMKNEDDRVDTEEEIARDREDKIRELKERFNHEVQAEELPYLLQDLASTRAGLRKAAREMNAVAAVIGRAHGLRKLHLTGLALTDRSAEALANVIHAMPLLETLLIPWTGGGYPRGGAGEGYMAFAKAIKTCPSLTSLDITGQLSRDSTPIILGALAFLNTLATLSLAGNELSGDGEEADLALARIIYACTSLTDLDLGRCSLHRDSPHLWEALRTNRTLRKLNLFGVGLTNSNLLALSDFVRDSPSLVRLNFQDAADVSHQTQVEDDGFAAFVASLAATRSLRSLKLSKAFFKDSRAPAVLAGFAANCSITKLDLDLHPGTDESLASVAAVIKGNQAMHTLYLTAFGVGDAGLHAIAEAIGVTTTLTSFTFRARNTSGQGSGFEAVCGALEMNTSIRELHISGLEPFHMPNLGDAGVAALARSLTTNSTLTSLGFTLPNRGTSASRLIELMGSFRLNKGLARLYLIGGKDETLQALAEALRSNHTLTSLSLSTRLGDPTALAFAETLRVNKTLTDVNMGESWSNQFGEESARAILTAIEGSSLTPSRSGAKLPQICKTTLNTRSCRTSSPSSR